MDDTDGVPHERPVTAWVGKGGVSAAVDEVANQLHDREFVKVRFHRSALGTDDIETMAAKLAAETDATVVDVRGRTAVLHT